MKPSNWRTFYWYRPSRSLSWQSYRLNLSADINYYDWLVEHRGFANRDEAKRYVGRTQKPCGLVSAHHFSGEPQLTITPKVQPVPPLRRIISAIRVLPWPAIEAIQAAIEERIAA